MGQGTAAQPALLLTDKLGELVLCLVSKGIVLLFYPIHQLARVKITIKYKKKVFKKSEKQCLLYMKITFITLAFKRKYEIPAKLCENILDVLL